jgi:DNA-3-methyladenine glycosylase I
VPCRDDRHLFEMLVLEGAQAGLSWRTILGKRKRYREVFDRFDPAKVAAYDSADVQRLLADPGIVRNRLKIESAIRNAQCVLALQQEHSSLACFLWSYVDGSPIQNAWRSLAEIPARTDLSDRLSKDLKKRGFNFVGSTICYAFMQSVGMVNDHLVTCYRHDQVRALG